MDITVVILRGNLLGCIFFSFSFLHGWMGGRTIKSRLEIHEYVKWRKTFITNQIADRRYFKALRLLCFVWLSGDDVICSCKVALQ